MDHAGALEKGPDTHDDTHVDEKVAVEEGLGGFLEVLFILVLFILNWVSWMVRNARTRLWKKQGTGQRAQKGKDAPIQKGVGDGVFVDADGASDGDGQGQGHTHGGTELGCEVLHEDGFVEHDGKLEYVWNVV